MKRKPAKFAVALCSFLLGVFASWLTSPQAPEPLNDLIPPAFVTESGFAYLNNETVTVPGIAQCFPGASLELRNLADQSGYFPATEFGSGTNSIASWYSKHLAAMQEPPLLHGAEGASQVYRFLWLRSFHHPVSIRVWRNGDEGYINVKELSGAGGYGPGELIVNSTRLLTVNEWQAFMNLLDQACFWGLPTQQLSMGNDGAQWILEGVKRDRYHVVDRWTPKDGAYRTACLYLLKISRLGIDEVSEDLY